MKKIGLSHLVGSESKQDEIDPVFWLNNCVGQTGLFCLLWIAHFVLCSFDLHIELWSLAPNNIMLKAKFKGKQNYY